MMKSLLVSLSVVAFAACHPPSLQDRARVVGHKTVRLGAKVVAVVRPADPQLDDNVRAVFVAQVQQTARAQLQQQAAAHPPSFVVHKSTTQVDNGTPAAEPASTQAPAPAMTVTRVNASRPHVVGLHGQTHGGRAICQTFSTLDTCNSECTSMLRATMMRAPTADDVKSCSCTEDVGC